MNPKKTTIVLIEYQNDFTTEGGTLHDSNDRLGFRDEVDQLNRSSRVIPGRISLPRGVGATLTPVPST